MLHVHRAERSARRRSTETFVMPLPDGFFDFVATIDYSGNSRLPKHVGWISQSIGRCSPNLWRQSWRSRRCSCTSDAWARFVELTEYPAARGATEIVVVLGTHSSYLGCLAGIPRRGVWERCHTYAFLACPFAGCFLGRFGPFWSGHFVGPCWVLVFLWGLPLGRGC